MKKLQSTVILACNLAALISFPVKAQEPLDPDVQELLALDLSSLSSVQAYTVSRSVTTIDAAPSIVTVITAEEILRRGYRTMHDVLARVPGFFPGVVGQSQEVISNRGSVDGGNRHYLYLLDGHTQNTITAGTSNAHIFPTLDKVKRIEIVRGPGSTLWGNSAHSGIIHVMTKNGADIDDVTGDYGAMDVTVDYETEHERKVASAQYGLNYDKGEVMFSITGFDSNADAPDIYVPTANGIELLTNALEPGWTSSSYSAWDHESSYDIYFKASYDDFALHVRDADMTTSFPWFESREGDGSGDWTMQRRYVELKHSPQLSNKSSLQTRIFFNDYHEIDEATYSPSQTIIRGYTYRDITYSEETLGAEAIYNYKTMEHKLLAGLYLDRQDLAKDETQDGVVVTAPSSLWNKIEHNTAVFIEDTYTGIDRWSFTLGGRLDKNSLRDRPVAFLPRFSMLNELSNNTILKYAYNTGYSRPARDKDNVNLDPEGSVTHDIQLLYRDAEMEGSITIFYNEFTDKIIWDSNAGNWGNGSDVHMRGIELNGSYKIDSDLTLYGNYGYSESKYDEIQDWSDIMDTDGRVVGIPKYVYNIGIDWAFASKNYLNLNLRGWKDAVTRWSWGVNDGFETFDSEYFVDANLYSRDLAGIKNFSLNLYVKNLLDNDNPYPDVLEGGYVQGPHPRTVGIALKYRF